MNNPQLNKHGELQHLLTTEGLPVRMAVFYTAIGRILEFH